MCENFWIGSIGFMLERKSLLDYTNLFSPNEQKKNDKIILKYFQITKKIKMKIIYGIFCSKHRKFKNIKKFHIFLKKDQFFLLFAVSEEENI